MGRGRHLKAKGREESACGLPRSPAMRFGHGAMVSCEGCRKTMPPESQPGRTIRQRYGKEGARAVLDGMDDLPDGAYFAMAEELGLDVEDLIDD